MIKICELHYTYYKCRHNMRVGAQGSLQRDKKSHKKLCIKLCADVVDDKYSVFIPQPLCVIPNEEEASKQGNSSQASFTSWKY